MESQSFSNDFFDFGDAIYLNAAFHGAIPRLAAAATEEAVELKKRPHLIRDEYHQTFPERYRRAAARLIEADPQDVAVTTSATDGIMTVVAGLDWAAGDEVVLPKGEFPANLFPWRSLATRGVRITEVDIGRGGDATERLIAACSPNTRVVSASWVSYSTGLILDLETLGAHCKERQILLVVDGSQGIGGLPMTVSDWSASVVTCAGYKWLLGPYGLGFVWISPDVNDQLVSVNCNWQSVVGTDDFSRLTDCELEYLPGARRFDMNEPASFFNLAAGTASLGYLAEVGAATVHRHAERLLERLVRSLPDGFEALGWSATGANSNILCIAPDQAELLVPAHRALTDAGISVSLREGAIRVSPHLYNSDAEIDELVMRLCEVARASSA